MTFFGPIFFACATLAVAFIVLHEVIQNNNPVAFRMGLVGLLMAVCFTISIGKLL